MPRPNLTDRLSLTGPAELIIHDAVADDGQLFYAHAALRMGPGAIDARTLLQAQQHLRVEMSPMQGLQTVQFSDGAIQFAILPGRFYLVGEMSAASQPFARRRKELWEEPIPLENLLPLLDDSKVFAAVEHESGEHAMWWKWLPMAVPTPRIARNP